MKIVVVVVVVCAGIDRQSGELRVSDWASSDLGGQQYMCTCDAATTNCYNIHSELRSTVCNVRCKVCDPRTNCAISDFGHFARRRS